MLVKTAAAMLVACGLIADTASAESMYNPLKSAVTIYNNKNFDKQVVNNREKGISVVQYYKAGGKLGCQSKIEMRKNMPKLKNKNGELNKLKLTRVIVLNRREVQERPGPVREVCPRAQDDAQNRLCRLRGVCCHLR